MRQCRLLVNPGNRVAGQYPEGASLGEATRTAFLIWRSHI